MSHWFGSIVPLLAAVLVSGCSPQAALLSALIPANTLSTLLGNFERVSEVNRIRVATLERDGQWAELGRLAEQNIAKDKANADWWLIAGYAHSQLGRHASAAEAYATAAWLEPDNFVAWNLLAQSYRAAGEPHRAVNTLNNALLAVRDSPQTYFLLGESYADLGRNNDAAAAYREALKIDARYTAAWYALAKAYERSGRMTQARDAESQLEKLDPQLAKRLREGRPGEARER